MTKAAFCSGCGTAIPDGSQFCPSCGERVGVAPPAWSGATGVEIATTYTYAGFWLRFVATIIDLIIVSVVSAFIGAIIAGGDDTGTVSATLNLFGDWLYCALMESSKFQGTVGKLVLGLIVTELVINALKHAFPGGRPGKIMVDYCSHALDWSLSVEDDGVGMPTDPAKAKAGLGTSIVEALARQLSATVSVLNVNPGTKVSVIHNEPGAGEPEAAIIPAV